MHDGYQRFNETPIKTQHMQHGGDPMTTIHLTATTPVAPERIVSAFTDFTPQRLRTFPNIDPRYYEVHAVGATSAEVTEGSTFFGGVWERAHYDWSHPGEITITVRSSNAFTFGSFWHYSIAAGEHGGSHVDFTLHRVGKNLKGRVLATMIRVFGQRIFRQDLAQTLKRLAEESPATALS
jgi:hypothetical protein